jgi:lipopolysaccharide transport system permease protein
MSAAGTRTEKPTEFDWVIQPKQGMAAIDLKELWRYRELFLFLVWRDVLVRYKQTVIGIAWAVIRPLLTMLIFTLIFNRVAKLPPPQGIPYPLLVMAGMLPWQFFATALTESSNSMVGNASLVTKIYFPRFIIPASSVMTSFVDFLITLGLMGLMMIWYGFAPDWRLVTLPLFMMLAFGSALGAGLWLCSLNVKYRDFRYVIPFIVQFGLYISPVGFSSSIVRGEWRVLYSFNPMVDVIDGFRWALLAGKFALWWPGVLISALLMLALCVSGIWHFRRVERTFADVI